MGLKQVCPYCKEQTLAKRLLGFYVGSTEQVKLWECRSCLGIWSEKTIERGFGLSLFFGFLTVNQKFEFRLF